MDPKLAAYTARKIVETFARDPNTSPAFRKVLAELLGAKLDTFTHQRINAQIKLTMEGMEHLENGVDVDLVTVIDATGKKRILILV